MIDVADTESIKKSEEDIADLQLSIARSEAQIQILVDALVNLSAPAVALNDRLLKLEKPGYDRQSVARSLPSSTDRSQEQKS